AVAELVERHVGDVAGESLELEPFVTRGRQCVAILRAVAGQHDLGDLAFDAEPFRAYRGAGRAQQEHAHPAQLPVLDRAGRDVRIEIALDDFVYGGGVDFKQLHARLDGAELSKIPDGGSDGFAFDRLQTHQWR